MYHRRGDIIPIHHRVLQVNPVSLRGLFLQLINFCSFFHEPTTSSANSSIKEGNDDFFFFFKKRFQHWDCFCGRIFPFILLCNNIYLSANYCASLFWNGFLWADSITHVLVTESAVRLCMKLHVFVNSRLWICKHS